MRRPRATVLLAMLLVFTGTSATAAIGDIQLKIERDVGYMIGDLVPYEIDITVYPSWTLQESSLPTPGNPLYWLELRRVDVRRADAADGRHYHLMLVYQTFYAPIEARTRELPGFPLAFSDGDESHTLSVPPLTITMSPLREVAAAEGGHGPRLQPDRPPLRLSLAGPLSLAATGAFALALSLLWLAHQHAWWPFALRAGRPFAQAARALRKGSAQHAYADALLQLHRAFDDTAGYRVLADDQERFLEQHGYFVPARPQIDAFFRASRRQFFAEDEAAARGELDADRVADLARSLARLERQRA